MRQALLLSLVLVVFIAAAGFSGNNVSNVYTDQTLPRLDRAPLVVEKPALPTEYAKGLESAPPQMNSILIDSSRNGYGFSSSAPKSADMTTDLFGTDWFGTAYRKFVPGDPNTGIIGVAELDVNAGFSHDSFTFWDYINNMTNYGLGGRYPGFLAAPEGPLPIWNQFLEDQGTATVSDAYLSFDVFGWGQNGGGFDLPVSWSQNSNPSEINGLWLGSTDLYKDNSGTYHVGGFWEIQLNSGSYTFLKGESSDLMSWSFNEGQVLWDSSEVEGNSPHFGWGSDGFGAWVSTGYLVGSGNEDFKILYSTTSDYGDTWTPVEVVEFSELGIPETITYDDSIYVPDANGDPVLYEGDASVGVTYDFDLVVTPNNEMHIGCTISWGPYADQAAGTYYPNGLYMGFYDMHSADAGQTWTSSRIGWNSGLLEGDSTGSWMTTNEIDLSYDGQGNIYAAWADRDRTEIVPSPYPPSNSNLTDTYNMEVWASMSNDGGNTWATPKQLTDDPMNCAQGIRLASRSKWYPNDNGKTYVVYQIADLNRPLAPPIEILCDHVQWLYVAEAKDFSFAPNSIQNNPDVKVENFTVHQNYPNPFNPTTHIQIDMNRAQRVQVAVFNTLGQKVAELHHGMMKPGMNTLTWNAADQASGVYMLQVKTAQTTEIRKMMLLK